MAHFSAECGSSRPGDWISFVVIFVNRNHVVATYMCRAWFSVQIFQLLLPEVPEGDGELILLMVLTLLSPLLAGTESLLSIKRKKTNEETVVRRQAKDVLEPSRIP